MISASAEQTLVGVWNIPRRCLAVLVLCQLTCSGGWLVDGFSLVASLYNNNNNNNNLPE